MTTYPFTEPFDPTGGAQTSSGTTMQVIWTNATRTVHKPNPFHGIDRWLFAFDEWLHRRGLTGSNGDYSFSTWWTKPFARYCNWWDRRMTGER